MDTKTILLPTDFTLNSLNLAKQAIEKNAHSNAKLNLLLVHGIDVSDSITDLLFFSKGKLLKSLIDDTFQEGCSVLRNGFGDELNSLRIDLFTGFTQSAFNAYVQANQVDAILYADSTTKLRPHRSSVDIRRFFSKAACDVEFVPHFTNNWESTSGSIGQLLKA